MELNEVSAATEFIVYEEKGKKMEKEVQVFGLLSFQSSNKIIAKK